MKKEFIIFKLKAKSVKNFGHRFCLAFKHSKQHHLVPKITALLWAASVAVFVALRIWSVWAPHLWGDELFNYSLSQGSLISLLKRTGLDMAHPPLFYLLLKPWIYLAGSSMSGLRVFTVAISVAAIAPLIMLGRELHLRTRENLLGLSLMAVNNYLILYSYYLRPYSPLLFLTLCSEVAFVRFFLRSESKEKWTLRILVGVNILLVYTHYFGWLVVVAQYLWVALTDRRHLRQITWAMAIVILCFLPWVGVIGYVSTKVSYTVLDQMSSDRSPSLQSIILLLRSFNGGFTSTLLTLAGSILFLLLVILGVKDSVLGSREPKVGDNASWKPLALLAWLTTFPIVTSLVASYAFTWIWMPRYVIVSTAPYLLLVAACAFRLRSPQARTVAVVFLLGWTAVTGFTDNLADALHGPNAPSYGLARDLSRAETRTEGPIRVYGLSPYAEQGLRLALSITGERRFEMVACPVDVSLPDDYFWVAVTEHDPRAAARTKELASDSGYSLGEPIYSGMAPQRHILIPISRK